MLLLVAVWIGRTRICIGQFLRCIIIVAGGSGTLTETQLLINNIPLLP